MKNTRIIALLGIAALTCLTGSHTAFAQESETVSLVNRQSGKDPIKFSFGNPDSPALSLAGLKANETTKVDELQNFSITLPKLADGETALALDFSPASIFMPIDSAEDTVEYYDGLSYFGRLQRRTKFSVLARNGKDDKTDPSKSVKSLIATGVSASIFDSSDPLAVRVDKQGECKQFIEEATTWIEKSPVTGLNDSGRIIEAIVGSNQKWRADLDLGMYSSSNIAKANLAILETRRLLASANHDFADIRRTDVTMGTAQLVGDQLLAEITEIVKFLNEKYPGKLKPWPALLKAGDVCYDAVEKARLYKPNLDFGAAALWRGTSDGFGDFKSGGQALWLSYRHPIKLSKEKSKHYFVFGATGRLSFSEFSTTGDMTTPESKSDTMQGWLGGEFFTDKWRMGGQVGYVDVKFDDPLMSSFSRNGEKWLVSTDYQVSDNIWLGVTYGEAQGTIEALDGERLTVDLKFSTPKALNLFNFKQK